MAIFTGTNESDTYSGNSSPDDIAGGAGADMLRGGSGNDTIYSADRSAPWFWTSGIPTLDTGTEVDTINGGTGSDTIYAGFGDNVFGGSEDDTLLISFQGATSGITVDFRQAIGTGSVVVGGATISSIEYLMWIEGSDYNDTIRDTDSMGYFAPIYGRGGNDTLIGGYYTGVIYGGTGNDTISRDSTYAKSSYGEEGDDIIYSASGGLSDGGPGNDRIYGASGFDEAIGGAGNDFIDTAAGRDTLDLGAGDDTAYGGRDEDFIDGGAGDDMLHGDHSLTGEADLIWGGDGADVIHGDQGSDQLWSGQREAGLLLLNENLAGLDDTGAERDELFGDAGNDILSLGIGDNGDGGGGNDTLRLSLLGSGAAANLNTSFFSPGGEVMLFGGTLRSFERFSYFALTRFDDVLVVSTMASPLQISGDEGDDLVTATGSSVVFRGDVGDDRLVSGTAADTFSGGDGTDTIDYSGYVSGVSVTFGLFEGQTGSGAGGDSFVKVENILGSAFSDNLNGSNAANRIEGRDGNDVIYGQGGHDTLVGGGGSDQIFGDTGDDMLDGMQGHDLLDGGWGADTMVGGTGNDAYVVDNAGDVITELFGEGTDMVNTTLAAYTLAANVEALTFTGTGPFAGTGNALNNRISGGSGADVLDGGAGADQMTGSLGNDTYMIDNTGDTANELADGGSDTVRTSLSSYFLRNEIENLAYIGGGDFIGNGNIGGNRITGGTGNDRLNGGMGGNDTLGGGLGNDTYVIQSHTGTVSIIEAAGEGTDTVRTDMNVFILAANVENLIFSSVSNITATGNAINNRIDTTVGGNDYLDGGGGADVLLSGNGTDTLIGGLGSDTLSGGSSGDRFVFNSIADFGTPGATDLITDFSHAQGDRIDLAAIDARNNLVGDQAFTFIGGLAFSKVAGQLRYSASGGITTVQGDVNGDGTADFSVRLTGSIALVAADFVL